MTKKLSLFKSWLLLLVLMVGSSAAWADELEWDLTKASYSSSTADEVTWSGNNVSMTLAKGNSQTNANNYLGGSGSYVHTRFYMGQVLTWTPASGTSISSITITTTGSNYNAGFKEGTWTNATASASGTTVTITPTIGTNPVSCIIKSATRATKVKVTYTTGGGSQKADCDLALTGAPVALTFDLYNNTTAQDINYTTSSTGAITVVANEYVETTVNENAKTISVTPKKKTSSAQTITVIQAADDNYNAGSATFTVSIDDSTPFTGGDVTFDATEDKGESPLVKNGVTFTCSNGVLNNGSEYRLYKNSTTTFSVASGKVITKIEFTGTSDNPASGFAAQTGFTTDGNNGTWTGSEETVSFTASGAQVRATKIVVTIEDATSNPAVATTVTIDATGLTNTNIYNGTAAGTLAATVKAGDTAVSGATVTWESSNTGVATIAADGTITLVAAGSTTITASYAGVTDQYKPSSATYELTVTNSDPNVPGTENNPYSVADVLALFANNTVPTSEVYVSGIISSIKSIDVTKYTRAQYYISDDGSTTDQFYVYNGLYLNGANFTANDQIQVGDEVVVYGKLTTFNNTNEFEANNYLVSLNRPVVTTPTLDVSPANVTVPYTGGSGDFTVTPNNVNNVIGGYITFYDPTNTETTTDEPSWINISYDSSNLTLSYSVTDENQTGADRTACFKYFIMCDNGGAVSNLITITQAKYVAPALDYATLPFAFDGGRDDIESTDGLTQEGLGSDYKDSPYLKFDGTGDYVVLHFNERPGTLTFDIENNSFSNGTFTVQTSEDGVTYTDLEAYTTITGTQNEEFDNLGENVRYIKWIYTEKITGNVALGNIELKEYTAPVLVPSIAVSPDAVDVPASAATPGSFIEGTLDITYKDLSITNMNDFDVQFYDVDGNELSTAPSWIDVLVAEQDPNIGVGYVVSYTIDENTDAAARSAYFKIYALDDATNIVYSNLVTITQAAYVAPGTSYQYALFTGDLVEGDYIIYYNGNAMNNDVQNNRLMYAEVTPENDVITTDNAAIVWHIAKSGEYWTIYNADADAYAASTGVKNKAQMLDDGTDDKALWTVSGTDTYEFVNKANAAANVNANLRNNGTYGFACYATSTGGALSLYKRVTEEVTVTAAGYATYCSTNALDFTGTGLKVYRAEIGNDSKVAFPEVTKVPANQGVLLQGAAKTYNIPVLASAEAFTKNDFVGVLTATDVAAGIFVLMNQNNKVGFYKTTKTFTVGAHTAYLPALASPTRDFIGFGDDATTGIGNVNLDLNDNKVYNLNGQRVNKAQKGLYIVNGKKVVLK